MKIGKPLLSTQNYFTSPCSFLLLVGGPSCYPCPALQQADLLVRVEALELSIQPHQGHKGIRYHCCLLFPNMILSLHMVTTAPLYLISLSRDNMSSVPLAQLSDRTGDA